MENVKIPILKGKPFFEQLKLSINFIDSNMKLIENSVKTSNTDEEYDYVIQMLSKIDKYNDDVNKIAGCLKLNNCLQQYGSEFEDEIQNLREILRCKEIDYQLEPFSYEKRRINRQNFQNIQHNQEQSNQQKVHTLNNFTSHERRLKLLGKNNNISEELNMYDLGLKKTFTNFDTSTNYLINRNNTNQIIQLNSQQNNLNDKNKKKSSSIKKKETFIFKDQQSTGDDQIKKHVTSNFAQLKKEQFVKEADVTNESIDPSNQSSFDFKLPYNKLKNHVFASNYSVDESLEIEFTPGLKTRRTSKKPYLNESIASLQDLQEKALNNSIKYKETFYVKTETDKLDSDKESKEDLIKQQQTIFSKSETLHHNGIFKKEPIFVHEKQSEKQYISPIKNIEKFDEKLKPQKLSTPKKPPNFDLFF